MPQKQFLNFSLTLKKIHLRMRLNLTKSKKHVKSYNF